MDQIKRNNYEQRIMNCRDPSLAKEIHTDLLQDRHNYFGRIFCQAIDIEYRNDIPFEKILDEIMDDVQIDNIPFFTPDNYIFVNNKLYLLDYKVSVSMESTTQTLAKYREKMALVELYLPFDYEVVIIKIDPYTKQLYINSQDFLNLYPNINIDPNFTDFIELRQMLLEKFADDDDFVAMIAHGDFTMTSAWTEEDCKQVYNNPIYKEFKYSMPLPYRRLFEESMNFNAYKSERWNMMLIQMRDYTKQAYDDYILDEAEEIKRLDGNYPKPSKEEILQGWRLMRRRTLSSRELITDPAKQKPSGHFIWAPPDFGKTNNNIQKILYLSKSLQKINEPDANKNAFVALGKMMDFSADIEGYVNYTTELKIEARKNPKKLSTKKLDFKLIGTSKIMWEQQFLLNFDLISKEDKANFFRKFLGIGNHKQFSKKTLDDLDLDQPKILDFDSKEVLLAARGMMNETKRILAQNSNLNKQDTIFDDYLPEIEKSSPEVIKSVNMLMNSKYWSCLLDISTIIKNLLSVSQYNRTNTFRVVTCANNNLFGLLFPSSDIKSQRSTMVYCIIAIHDTEILNPGSLYRTFKIGSKNISISRAMRLDKARCQRLVTAPGLFIQTAALFKGDNEILDIYDIANFAFYTSISITKSMLSLTEPARYMMMNSLAISSHVKDYIAEKFSPYTKTLFSVYVCNLIKKGCLMANEQKDKIELRDVFMTDYEFTQKGVKDERSIDSIWFPGKVNLKEFINQIYLPFYFNAKGLHEKHHVLINLAKTVIEIELEQRREIKEIWSSIPKKQTVNLQVFLHALSKNLILDTSRHNHLRSRVENRNNLKRSLTTIPTFTSSKSCIKVGDFKELKEKTSKVQIERLKKEADKVRIATPYLVDETMLDLQIKHANYKLLRESVPEYQDYISTKVFDSLYTKLKTDEVGDGPAVSEILKVMRTKEDFYFTFFNKEQKTYVDREIFVGEFEAKMCMYLVERIAKERCKLNPEEMISEPGDGKLKVLEQRSEFETRYIVKETVQYNKNIIDKFENYEAAIPMLKKGFKLEINADMSKWSAQDVMYKFFWLTALDPILYPQEKEHILNFLCNYMRKRLILPDNLMYNLLDQKVQRADDIIALITDGFRTNHFNVKRNWLQGNFNYVSSYLHAVSMSTYKDLIKATVRDGQTQVNSLVHSDDNQTSIIMIQDLYPEDVMIHYILTKFERVCLSFGCQANMKKTYATNVIKEFVSLFNICGEPFSIYGRFLLTAVGDAAYLGPYEDFASRISAAQTAIKHGCPPSLAWLSIAIANWITSLTYNMLPGQANDPSKHLEMQRSQIPIELGGSLNAPLYLTALLGLESDKIYFLLQVLRKIVNPMLVREEISTQVRSLTEDSLVKLNEVEILKLKLIRYLSFDSEISPSDTLGETSDMKTKSILTPRKFTTSGVLKKLTSYVDFQNLPDGIDPILDFMIENPELLVTKGETKEQFINSILFRYQSRKFKESLSIQNPVQLFIEQILFSNKPTIDYKSIFRDTDILPDSIIDEKHNIHGNVTIAQALINLKEDLKSFKLDIDDLRICFLFTILNDPLVSTAANSFILSVQSNKMSREGLSCASMPEFRNMRIMHHSPALVLKAFTRNQIDLPGSDPEEMRRDLNHLEHFINETKIVEKMQKKIIELKEDGTYTKQSEIRELTKIYQTCYDYIKSTEHKVKVFILPHKAYTTIDFCSLLQGNMYLDKYYITMHYLKQITTHSKKGEVQMLTNTELLVAREAFRVLPFFLDTFIASISRIDLLKTIVAKFTYKDMKVSDLLTLIENSNARTDYIPILYRLDKLEQRDLDRYDALKSDDAITWNQWQINRTFDTGEIDLLINGKDKYIRIIGIDDKLTVAELHLPSSRAEDIRMAGRRLLNQRHGLRLERMRDVIMEERQYYITYQKRYKNQYHYAIYTEDYINNKNAEIKSHATREHNLLIPVCLVYIAVDVNRARVLLEDLEYLNYENFEVSRLKLTIDEYATVKRAQINKMLFFDGPEIDSNLISINGLMKSQELLDNTYSRLVSKSIIPIAKIFKCNQIADIEDEVLVFNDEPMEETESIGVQSEPLFNVVFTKKGEKQLTYKNALVKMITSGLERFEMVFDFSGDGFFSSENRGLIEMIVSIIQRINTNEWSTIMMNTIHLLYIKYDMDREFHAIETPEAMMAEDQLNIDLCLDFIAALPSIKDDIWSNIFDHFKSKANDLLLEMRAEQNQDLKKFMRILKKKDKVSKGIFSYF
ncbi:RNA-dependent RNA polymerase [Maprik virus]|uniref:RNA-directed RNA polymerase L n=1 Tax=Maprik virus TaxID=1590836 RepID=A0A0B4ZQF3_9VIRU|nr:RNA-dependent RNA polymerase [Maprik virus]AJD77607.1 RNA-dependent RNA polymerase [Maprik virus]